MSAGRRALAAVSGRRVARARVVDPREVDPDIELGSLHATPITVVADDGVPLYVEVDEFDPAHAGPGAKRRPAAPPVTLVFIHGYSLNLDCWHFQRAAYGGLVRAVYYDQRSHGRSERSSEQHATIDQLGGDLRRCCTTSPTTTPWCWSGTPWAA
ncbi:MAG: hypothetical protein R2731_15210 [Nocardioides sp.]